MFPLQHLSHLEKGPNCITESIANDARFAGRSILDNDLGEPQMTPEGIDYPGAETYLTSSVAGRTHRGLQAADNFYQLYGNE